MLQLNVDCLVLIFNELKDKKSLHSCLLVNREWCRLVVPILWKKYSCYNESILNTILSFLPPSSKQLLHDNNIELPPTTIFLKPPLFNYISFCEFPISDDVNGIVKMILEISSNFRNYCNKRKILEQEIYKLFISQCKNIKKLSWSTSQLLSLFPGASTCFSQLNSLFINLNYNINSSALYEMAQICKDLNELEIFYRSKDLPGLVSLIDAQKNLSKVKIYYYNRNNNRRGGYEEQSKALARKGNTINILHLSLGTIPPSFLTSLVNLTRVSIYNNDFCENVDEIKEFRHYLAISEFPNLQCLSVDGLSCFKELAMLIEKTKGNILHVRISIYNTKTSATTNTGMLIKSIANNCPKIKSLCTHLNPDDFIHIKLFLLNCRQLMDIKFNDVVDVVDVDEINNDIDNIGDELLDVLTKFSSKSLNYISISGSWKYSIDTFERFFESCRERPLHLFHVFNKYHFCITEGHKSVVRKYINEGVITHSNCV